MEQQRMYIKVGIFVFIGLVFLAYHTVKLGKMEVFSAEGQTVQARFSSVSGLKTGASVELAGVQVGKVTGITLAPPLFINALVTFSVNKELALTDDTIVSVKTSGIIGDKYLSLSLGGGDPYKAGSVLTDTESSLDIESLISKFAFGEVK